MATNPTPPLTGPSTKKAYNTPVVMEFGAVADLTAGGSGAQPELKIEIFMMCFAGMLATKSITLC